jgi:hypothetical protein
MSVIIRFGRDEDHVRAIDVLSDSDETYHGVAPGTILVSNRAVRELQERGVGFQIVGANGQEGADAAGA